VLCMLRQLRVPTGAERSGRFQTKGRYCGTGSATRVTSCVNPGTSPLMIRISRPQASSCWCRRRPQPGNEHQNIREHLSRHRDLGHLLVWTAPDGIERARLRSLLILVDIRRIAGRFGEFSVPLKHAAREFTW